MIKILTWLLARQHDSMVDKRNGATLAGQGATLECHQSHFIVIDTANV